MKINVTNFGFSAAISAAIFALVRSLFFLGMPGWGMMMDRPMMQHDAMNQQHMMGPGWSAAGYAFSWPAALAGVVFWAVGFGLFAALLAWIYNKLDARSGTPEI